MMTARSAPRRKEIKKRFMVMRWGNLAVEEPPRGFGFVHRVCAGLMPRVISHSNCIASVVAMSGGTSCLMCVSAGGASAISACTFIGPTVSAEDVTVAAAASAAAVILNSGAVGVATIATIATAAAAAAASAAAIENARTCADSGTAPGDTMPATPHAVPILLATTGIGAIRIIADDRSTRDLSVIILPSVITLPVSPVAAAAYHLIVRVSIAVTGIDNISMTAIWLRIRKVVVAELIASATGV